MNKLVALLIMSVFALPCAVHSAATCSKCESIRNKRVKNPEPMYEYYEDYIEAEKSAKSKTSDGDKIERDSGKTSSNSTSTSKNGLKSE